MSAAKEEEIVEDFLSEDPEIPSQRVVLLSFLSPEKVLEKKEAYFFKEFLQHYSIQWKTSKFEEWLANHMREINTKLEKLAADVEKTETGVKEVAETIRKSEIRIDRLVEEYEAYCRSVQKEIKTSDIQTEYEDFMFKNEQRLEEEYHKLNNYHTTIRGIKVRGVYATEGEASARAKRLQKSDPNFNIYLGAVGKWMAWDPNPNNVSTQEYANEQLNTLMKKYRDNEEARDHFYTEQKKRMIGQAKAAAASVEAAGEGNAAGPIAGGAVTEQYGAMFEGQGDLAIARKMQNRLDKD